MFDAIKSIFLKKQSKPNITTEINRTIGLDDIRTHFNNNTPGEFIENAELINKIKSKIKPNRKNIFILDDICEIVQILEEDFKKYLEKVGRLDDFNLIPMCRKTVGFDVLSIAVNHPEISIDAIMSDIVFGGNEKINGKKIIIDGIDVVIMLKSLNDKLNYLLFTGNVFGENMETSHSFSKKFEKSMGEPIFDHVLIKDAQIIFEDSIFERIIDAL